MHSRIRKIKVATGTLTLPTDVSTANDIILQDEVQDITTIRQKLNRFLNLLSVQGVVVAVVVLDVLLVTFLLLMELNIIQAPGEDDRSMMRRSTNSSSPESHNGRVHKAEQFMHITQLIILVVFLLEIIMRVLSRGVDLIYDKWQVFDSLVVVVTCVLYVSLTAAVTSRRVTYSVGYLILPRLWRIGRIHYDLTQPVIQKARSLILAHRRAWRETDEQLKQIQQRADRQQEKIEVLKAKLIMLQSVDQRQLHSPAFSTESRSSDDETDAARSGDADTLSELQLKPSSLFYNLRSQSLPTTTPRAHTKTDASISLPASPKSLSFCHGNQLISYGSSGKIPDLVEHTQVADTYRDHSSRDRSRDRSRDSSRDRSRDSSRDRSRDSSRDALTLQALALDSSRKHKSIRRQQNCVSVDSSPNRFNQDELTTGHKSYSQSDVVLPSVGPSKHTMDDRISRINAGPTYIKNPDRTNTGRSLGQHHREKSASTGALTGSPLHIAVNNNDTSSQVNIDQVDHTSMTRPRIRKDGNGNHDSKHYPRENGDKVYLLTEPARTRSCTDYAFSNPSFSPEELDRIEKEEIERVSQIPFDLYGSISHLLREGIPISEL